MLFLQGTHVSLLQCFLFVFQESLHDAALDLNCCPFFIGPLNAGMQTPVAPVRRVVLLAVRAALPSEHEDPVEFASVPQLSCSSSQSGSHGCEDLFFLRHRRRPREKSRSLGPMGALDIAPALHFLIFA